MTQLPSQPSSPNLPHSQNGTSLLAQVESEALPLQPVAVPSSPAQLEKPTQSRKLSIRSILVIPFLLQIFGAVGLTGYLSLRNGQKAVNDLVARLQTEVSNRVEQHLDNYAMNTRYLTQINGEQLDSELLDVKDPDRLVQLFVKQVKTYNVGYILLGTKTGEEISAGYYREAKIPDHGNPDVSLVLPKRYGNGDLYNYETDEQGKLTKLFETVKSYPLKSYPFEKEGWYAKSITTGKSGWSDVYQWQTNSYPLAIATSRPIYDRDGNLIGSLGVEQRLSQISDFLRQIQISKSSKVFILERNNFLVASSGNDPVFSVVNQKPQRLRGVESKDALIQATSRHLSNYFGDLKTIQKSQQLAFGLNGQRQFVQVTPWRDEWGLDWLVVVAMPESDFMAQINANTRTTILLCLAALVLATLLGLLAARWITRSLNQLNQATKAISDGQLDQTVEAAEIKELDSLGQSFNQMATQLRGSFESLEQTNRRLEQANQELEMRVEERTAELRIAKEASEQTSQALQQRALQLLKEVDPVNQGDLTIRAQVTADEIGTIADACNAMVENLRKIVLQVQTAASQVVDAAQNNETSIQTLTTEAFRQAQESTAALQRIEEIVAVVRAVADHAHQAEGMVQEAAQAVQEGDNAMNRTVEGIQSIRTTVAKTAKKVKHLGESSQKISMVVELINDFANRTRLLALNASIEAALAGKDGRGFGMVAEEVRALARRSTEATEEIRRLIANIQAETNEVIVTMESSTEEVVMGTKLVDETRQSLDKITTASAQMNQLVKAITQATTMQFEASETVAQTMKDMATIATKTSTEAEHVSASFEQLRQVAQTLQADVAQFKVD